jgi:hypothetical protein
MITIVVPPATDLPVHIFHLMVVGFHQLPLVGSDAFIYHF